MSWLIYKSDPESSQRLYVTGKQEGCVGYFGGPGALDEAHEWDDKAAAARALEWLNNPETFYGPQELHVLEEKP